MSTELLGPDADWGSLWERCGTNPYQHPQWSRLDASQDGGDPRLLVHRPRDGASGVAVPLLLREVGRLRVGFSPYGFPGLLPAGTSSVDPAVLDDLPEALTEVGVDAVLVRSDPFGALAAEADSARVAVVPHGPTASIDLRGGLDEARAVMRGRLRTDVRKLLRSGYSWAVEDVDATIGPFATAYAETMRRVGAPDRLLFDDAYWRRITELELETAMVVVRDGNDAFASAGLFLHGGLVAHYHLGATKAAVFADNPAKLMYWGAAEHFAARGDTDFVHLGGGVGAARDGLYQLKRGFGRCQRTYATLRVLAADTAPSDVVPGASLDELLRADHFPPPGAGS